MGFRFRKSKSIGPFRVTLSKSGLGASVGVKGFRVTKTASGRVRATASIPGTGISYVKETGVKKPKSPVKKQPPAAPVQQTVPFDDTRPKRGHLGFAILIFVALFVALAYVLAPKAAARTEYTDISQLEEDARYTKEDMLAIYELGYRNGLRDAGAGGDSLTLVTRSAEPTPEPVEATYILNTNTKKFHDPSCKSVNQIKDKNRDTFTGSREDLISRGYSPCGNCKPK